MNNHIIATTYHITMGGAPHAAFTDLAQARAEHAALHQTWLDGFGGGRARLLKIVDITDDEPHRVWVITGVPTPTVDFGPEDVVSVLCASEEIAPQIWAEFLKDVESDADGYEILHEGWQDVWGPGVPQS